MVSLILLKNLNVLSSFVRQVNINDHLRLSNRCIWNNWVKFNGRFNRFKNRFDLHGFYFLSFKRLWLGYFDRLWFGHLNGLRFRHLDRLWLRHLNDWYRSFVLNLWKLVVLDDFLLNWSNMFDFNDRLCSKSPHLFFISLKPYPLKFSFSILNNQLGLL